MGEVHPKVPRRRYQCLPTLERNPGRNIECTRARMMEKSPDVQFGIRFSTWNVGSMLGKWGKYLRFRKDVVLIFAVYRK